MRVKLVLLFACLVLLAGCAAETPGQTDPVVETTAPIEQLTMVVTEETLLHLEEYTQLKRLDLTGSTCYSAIARYMQAHPRVDVTYTVELETVTVGNKETYLVLDPSACSYETLAENLAYLPRLETVYMPLCEYTPDQMIALVGMYPDIRWSYSVVFLGQELTQDMTALNLSVLTPEQVSTAVSVLHLFPKINQAELMDTQGESLLGLADVKALLEGAPHVDFHYTFSLFGQTVSTKDTALEFVGQDLGSDALTRLREALDVLPVGTRVLLDNCGLENEDLALLRADYPDREIVWRVFVGKNSWLTDTETIRANGILNDANASVLGYCTQVRYADLVHNHDLTDISFLSKMPGLEILLLSGCPVTDLTPLEGSAALRCLELAYCESLEELSPLALCKNLAYLNLSYTKVTDLAVLEDKPLRQLYAVVSVIPWSEQNRLQTAKPDCWFRFDGSQAYGTGWRYEKTGFSTDIYKEICAIFGYQEN